jgi:hypothetical protein
MECMYDGPVSVWGLVLVGGGGDGVGSTVVVMMRNLTGHSCSNHAPFGQRKRDDD